VSAVAWVAQQVKPHVFGQLPQGKQANTTDTKKEDVL